MAGITTTAGPDGIPLAGEYEIGGLDRESYVSPWTVLTVRHDHVYKRVAVTSADVVEATGDAIASYVGAI